MVKKNHLSHHSTVASTTKKEEDDLFGDFIEINENKSKHPHVNQPLSSDEDDFGEFQEHGSKPSLVPKCKSQGNSIFFDLGPSSGMQPAKKNTQMNAFSGGPFDF